MQLQLAAKVVETLCCTCAIFLTLRILAIPPPPLEGGLGKVLVGVCRWDSETLNLYQTTFRSFLQPSSRLDAKNPYLIPD